MSTPAPVLADGIEVRTTDGLPDMQMYTERLATNGEEHLLCQNCGNASQGLNPQDPSSLVYAINVKGHAPILLGAMYLMGGGNGPQVGGGLTRWHSHLEVCENGRVIIAGFGVALPGTCDPSRPGQLAP